MTHAIHSKVKSTVYKSSKKFLHLGLQNLLISVEGFCNVTVEQQCQCEKELDMFTNQEEIQ